MANLTDADFKWPDQTSVLGTHVKRLDGPEKVSGRAKYTFDIARPRMLYGRIVRSPYPHARVVSVDLSQANSMPGVKTTLVWRDPANAQKNLVMFQGDEVAAVAADTEEHAIDAARAIKVEYEVLPHVTIVERALSGAAPAVFNGGNVRASQPQQSGDVAAGFQTAAHVVEETYSTQVITHTCMETHGTVCEWDGDKLTAWISTQGVNGARENFASALGIPQANVRVICQYMGGGFGSKALSVGAEGLICAKLAQAAKAPVKLMLDRKEEHLATGNRPSATAHIKAGVSADGIITAFDARVMGHGRRWRDCGFPAAVHLSDCRTAAASIKTSSPTPAQQRPMRAPGHPQGSFNTEIIMDELADQVNMDPVEFRIKNLPPEAPNAMWRAYLREGAAEFGWNKRHATGDQDARPDQNRHGRFNQHLGRRRTRTGAGPL